MQPRFKLSLFLAFSAILFLSSCGSKTNKQGRYIPANAAFVLHFNGESLNAKLSWDEIKKSDLFKEAYADTSTPAVLKSIMDNPENAGIDVKNDILFFAVKDSAGDYFAVEGNLKDEAKFKQFNISMNKTPGVETEKDGVHFIATDEMTASWNKEKFVYVVDAPGMNGMNYQPQMNSFDTSGTYTPPVKIKKDLNSIAAKIFALKEDNSLAKEEKFTDLVKTTGDIHFWMNLEAMDLGSSNMPGMAALSMINFKKIYEGSRTTATVNFDNGKIDIDFKSYSGKEMTDLIKKYSGDKINADMVKRIPSKNIAALFALNFKPEGLREYLKLLGLEGFANMGTSYLGFNLDDFIKANKGDILFAVTDITQDSSGHPAFSAMFSASIGDKPSFGKLVEAGKKLSAGKTDGPNGPAFFSNMNDNYFILGTKSEDVNKYLSTANNSNPDFFDKISGSSAGVYINFQYILKSMSNEAKDSTSAAIHDASVKMWDNLIANGNGIADGASKQHIEINLVDKSTNSLKQLNSYFGTVGMLMKKKTESYKTRSFDETTAPIDSTEAVRPH